MGSWSCTRRPTRKRSRSRARGAARGRAYREPRRRARGAPIWKTEFSGFLFGDLLQQTPTQLAALQPHRAGRFPVVLVHGTASSAARWAELVNDLSADPRIRDRFEFWFFSYETGNPIPYSALRRRRALARTVVSLDPLQATIWRCATWC